MIIADLQILTQVLAERLLNSAAAGIVLAGLVWMLLRLIGRQNAGTRFAIWFSALLAVVAFPFLSRSAFAHLAFHADATIPQGEIVLSSSWASYLFAGWIAGATLLLSRLVFGVWRVRCVRRNCTELQLDAVCPAVARILRGSASRRVVSLCTSRELAVPAAVGLFRPAIVFPESLWPQLSDDELEMIVRHELAHLSRWDDWTNLIQKLVKAVLFFHPAVWWIESRLTLEREMACDDIVLSQTASPRAYASSLISFAEKLHCARGLALAQLLVSRMHQMSLRVARILDIRRPGHAGLWKPALGLSAGLLTAALGAAPYMPRVVAFQSQPEAAPALPGATATVEDAGISRSLAVPVVLRESAFSHPKAIPAMLHQRSAPLQKSPLRARVPRTPLILRTSVRPTQPIVQETIFILRAPQTPQYDASAPRAPEIWTLCIWRVTGNDGSRERLESAIVVRWI